MQLLVHFVIYTYISTFTPKKDMFLGGKKNVAPSLHNEIPKTYSFVKIGLLKVVQKYV
jgi:hypothetical protein